MYIFPYKAASQTAKELARALGIKRIKTERSKFKGGVNKLVINWGSSELPPEVMKCRMLNNPGSVSVAANKLSFFEELAGQGLLPDHTTELEVAQKWVQEGRKVVCRTILNGNSGRGIVLASALDELVKAPLYVVYVPKKDEYRVHVGSGGGEVIDVQKKAVKKGFEGEVNHQIRNHGNGYVFIREGINPPDEVLTKAKACVNMLCLDFGAVDIIHNFAKGLVYVLEVNTAPGLEGTTLSNYVEYFKRKAQ